MIRAVWEDEQRARAVQQSGVGARCDKPYAHRSGREAVVHDREGPTTSTRETTWNVAHETAQQKKNQNARRGSVGMTAWENGVESGTR